LSGLSVGFVTWRTPKERLAGFLESLVTAVATLRHRTSMPVVIYAICNDAPQEAIGVETMIRAQAEGRADIEWQFLHGHGNVGYGAAQNLAIRRTDAEFHLICNPDLVMAPGALLDAAGFLEMHPDAVLAAPQGYDAEGQYARLAKRSPTLLALALVVVAAMLAVGQIDAWGFGHPAVVGALVVVPLAVERGSEGERPGERDGNPQDARRRPLHRLPRAHEGEREDEHARDGEEQRRRHHFPAPRLDRQVLAHHEPGHPQEVSRHAIGPVRGARPAASAAR